MTMVGMTRETDSPDRPKQGGRGLGWAMLVVGVILCLGTLSSVASGGGTSTGGAAETAGAVIGRLIMLALGIAGIVYGLRRIRR